MTYGVPYLFVPGTKAKADEVNANFIDVLDKVDAVNLRVDNLNESSNTKLEDLENNKLKLDLSNLDEEGKKVLDAKANASLLDGPWVNKHLSLASNRSISANTTQNYSLNDYLPDKTNKYLILISLYAHTGTVNGNSIYLYMKSDYTSGKMPIARTVTRSNGNAYDCGQCIIPTASGRLLSIMNSGGNGVATYTFEIQGYRKVR